MSADCRAYKNAVTALPKEKKTLMNLLKAIPKEQEGISQQTLPFFVSAGS